MIRKLKPTSPGIRQLSYEDFSEITKSKPEKSLISTLVRHAGRDNRGRVSIRHQGAGVKRFYRLVDFKQGRHNETAKVIAIEYDPYRSARIALIEYEDGTKKYILSPQNIKIGSQITNAEKSDITIGNRMKLKNIPLGTAIYNVELAPGRGGQIARSAGLSCSVIAKDSGFAHVKLPSGEIRKISVECFASIGALSNPEHNLITIGKAGRMRHMGIRPTVRGKAMHPAAHPHGGGEGVNPIGLKYPKTKWGKHALGVKTRRNKQTDKYIIQRRKK